MDDSDSDSKQSKECASTVFLVFELLTWTVIPCQDKKKIKECVKNILNEEDGSITTVEVRRQVRLKLDGKLKSCDSVIKFNALVDSSVAHFKKKEAKTNAGKTASKVLKPILKK